MKRRLPLILFLLCPVISFLVVLGPILDLFPKKNNDFVSEDEININGKGFLEIRINDFLLKGNETEIKADVYLKIDNIKQNPQSVYLEYFDEKHPRGRYKIEGKYSEELKTWEGERKNIPFYPRKGNLKQFPFDNLSFQFKLNIDPFVYIREIHFYKNIYSFNLNNVSGNTKFKEGILVDFKLKRKLYSKILFGAIALFLGGFILVTILTVKSVQLAITSLVSFFISMFSIRSVTLNFIKGYIALIDIFFLFISILLLLVIIVIFILEKVNGKNLAVTSHGGYQKYIPFE